MPTKSSRSSTLLPPGRWTVDPSNSSVSFRVRHFGIAAIQGRFARFAGRSTNATLRGAVDVASVQAGHSVRDARLAVPRILRRRPFPADRLRGEKLHRRNPKRPPNHSRCHPPSDPKIDTRHTSKRRTRRARQSQDQPQGLRARLVGARRGGPADRLRPRRPGTRPKTSAWVLSLGENRDLRSDWSRGRLVCRW